MKHTENEPRKLSSIQSWSERLQHIRRILVIRMGPLGETLQTTPVLSALRNHIPDAYIAMMVTSDREDLISANPNLDRAILYQKSAPKLISTLRQHQFQMVLILQPTFRLVLLTFFAGIKYRVGFITNSGGRFLLAAAVANNQDQHETDRYLDVVRAIGIPPVTNEIEMHVAESAEQWTVGILKGAGVSRERLLIGLNPGGFWPKRRWAKERFVQLADLLGSEYNAQVLITTGPSEVSLGGEIAELMRHQPVVVRNTTPMRIAAMLQRCHLLISNDTGPMHIGISVGTPTIGLFGRSNPRKWGPISAKHAIVHRDGMDAITVADVMLVARRMLAELPAGSQSNPDLRA